MVRNVARVTVPTCQCWIVGDTTTIRFRFMDQSMGSDWLCDLWPWKSWRLELMWVVVFHPYTKFEVRNPWHSEDMAHDMCQHHGYKITMVSINGPGDPDLWPFDLETGIRVASKAGNLPSKFGHAIAFGFSNYSSYATQWQTDKDNVYCRLPYGRGHNNKPDKPCTVHCL